MKSLSQIFKEQRKQNRTNNANQSANLVPDSPNKRKKKKISDIDETIAKESHIIISEDDRHNSDSQSHCDDSGDEDNSLHEHKEPGDDAESDSEAHTIMNEATEDSSSQSNKKAEETQVPDRTIDEDVICTREYFQRIERIIHERNEAKQQIEALKKQLEESDTMMNTYKRKYEELEEQMRRNAQPSAPPPLLTPNTAYSKKLAYDLFSAVYFRKFRDTKTLHAPLMDWMKSIFNPDPNDKDFGEHMRRLVNWATRYRVTFISDIMEKRDKLTNYTEEQKQLDLAFFNKKIPLFQVIALDLENLKVLPTGQQDLIWKVNVSRMPLTNGMRILGNILASQSESTLAYIRKNPTKQLLSKLDPLTEDDVLDEAFIRSCLINMGWGSVVNNNTE